MVMIGFPTNTSTTKNRQVLSHQNYLLTVIFHNYFWKIKFENEGYESVLCLKMFLNKIKLNISILKYLFLTSCCVIILIWLIEFGFLLQSSSNEKHDTFIYDKSESSDGHEYGQPIEEYEERNVERVIHEKYRKRIIKNYKNEGMNRPKVKFISVQERRSSPSLQKVSKIPIIDEVADLPDIASNFVNKMEDNIYSREVDTKEDNIEGIEIIEKGITEIEMEDNAHSTEDYENSLAFRMEFRPVDLDLEEYDDPLHLKG